MEAKELRIGNYVKYAKEVLKFAGQTTEITWMSLEDTSFYYPIPLTEEWHNKFGVVKNGFNNFEYALPRKNNMGIKIIFNGEYVMLRQGFGGVKDDIVVIWNKDVSKRDMYVHEWQNLYYTLASKELTLKN